MDINDVLARHEGSLMAVPGVVGVGAAESEGQPALLVMLSHLTSETRRALPEHVEGYAVKLEVVGEITAFPAE